MVDYEETEEFKKDLEKLLKKFRSLDDDLKTVKKAVIEMRHVHEIDNLSTFQIPGFGNENLSFWKIKKFACKALKGRGVKSGIRVIYAYEKETEHVSFIEIYFKADKENEDKDRLSKFGE